MEAKMILLLNAHTIVTKMMTRRRTRSVGVSDRGSSTSAIEDWGLLTSFVVVDAAVHVVGSPPGPSAITVTSLLLLESVSELLQQESVLVDFCLELTELL